MTLRPQILVIRQLALGDVILVTPIIRKIWEDYGGDCDIDVCTLKPDVFANNPWVRDALLPQQYLEYQRYYDKSINLDRAYEKLPKIHITDAYSRYAFGLADCSNPSPALFTTPEDKLFAQNYIAEQIGGRKFGVIHMRRDTWPSRNLAPEFWEQLVTRVVNETQMDMIQIGSLHEIAFDGPKLTNALGKFTLHQLKEVIESASFYIGIDSGTMHVAACTKTPIISMFTSAHHDYRKPRRPSSSPFFPITPDIDCYGCQAHIPPPITGVICQRGDVECINRFSIDQIVNVAKGITG